LDKTLPARATQIYTQLIVFESDEYHSATATKTDEAEKLVQAGFEYVCTTTENLTLFRKRKGKKGLSIEENYRGLK
jgi:hypothetical protein